MTTCARLAFVRFCVMASMRVSPARVAKAERMVAGLNKYVLFNLQSNTMKSPLLYQYLKRFNLHA